MIKPINGHVLIEPLKSDSFMLTQKDTYQEIGTVVTLPHDYPEGGVLWHGTKVLFDAWLAKKYPKEGSTTEYYWLVRFSDIVAYDDGN